MKQLKPLLFFVVVGSIAGFFVYREATKKENAGIVTVGQQAPDFSLKDENGREVKLSDFRGKLVFLNFWATWCVPCVDEMPEMETLKNAFKDRKFQMLAVSVDLNWDLVHDFYKQHNLTIPAVLDPGGGQIARGVYKVTGWPETFLIDANGSVLKHVIGQAHWADPRVMANLETMLPQDQQVSTR